MKIPVVYWLTSAAVAVIGVGLMTAGFFEMQRQTGTVTETFEESGFTSIRTELPHTSVQLISSGSSKTATVELKGVSPTVKVFEKDGTLWVTDAGWANLRLFYFGFMHEQLGEVIITLPEEDYESILLSADSGRQNSVFGVHAGELTIKTGAGNWLLEQIETDTLTVDSGAGDFSLSSVHVLDTAEFEIGAGNVELKDCTFWRFAYSQGAGNLVGQGVSVQGLTDIESGTGDCIFDVCQFVGDTRFDCGMGDIELNDLRLSGDMDISIGAGNLTIGILGNAEDYTVDCGDHVGNVSIAGRKGTVYNGGSKHTITIDGVGNVDVSFHD